MKKLLILTVITGLFMGCAQDFYTPYNNNIRGTGNATIKLSAPMRNVSITMNDSLITEGKFTKKVVIENIPAGEYHIEVIGTDNNRKSDLHHINTLQITPNSHKTILIETPGLSTGYWIYSAVIFLVIFSSTYYVSY